MTARERTMALTKRLLDFDASEAEGTARYPFLSFTTPMPQGPFLEVWFHGRMTFGESKQQIDDTATTNTPTVCRLDQVMVRRVFEHVSERVVASPSLKTLRVLLLRIIGSTRKTCTS